jgi:uncharacterized membrane-anchored protein
MASDTVGVGQRPYGGAAQRAIAKVPQVTLAFWLIKIVATTLGETGGDWVQLSATGSTNRWPTVGCK